MIGEESVECQDGWVLGFRLSALGSWLLLSALAGSAWSDDPPCFTFCLEFLCVLCGLSLHTLRLKAQAGGARTPVLLKQPMLACSGFGNTALPLERGGGVQMANGDG